MEYGFALYARGNVDSEAYAFLTESAGGGGAVDRSAAVAAKDGSSCLLCSRVLEVERVDLHRGGE
jgi:hypothetical protein